LLRAILALNDANGIVEEATEEELMDGAGRGDRYGGPGRGGGRAAAEHQAGLAGLW